MKLLSYVVRGIGNELIMTEEETLMKHIPLDDLLTDTEVDDAKIDELFSQLGHFEPPVDMVANIMQMVSQLPSPKPLSTWKALDFLEVDFDESQLC